MQSSFISKFTSGFFWFGFCVFLGASIPHIAAFYRHFDPNATPGSIQDITDWVIGYLIAIVIDVTDVLVSIAVLKALNSGARKRDLIGYWSFILFVMSLSWLVNWQYDIVYQTNAFAKAENIAIFGVLVGAVNPVIGSAFQLLLLVYTAMAHKFAEKPVQKTAVQLRQEADELEQVAMQQARIDAVKTTQAASKMDGFFDSIGQAKERAKKLLNTPQPVQNEENIEQEETPPEQMMPVQNDNAAKSVSKRPTRLKVVENKAERVQHAIMDNPTLGNRAIARMINVAPSTVGNYRKKIDTGEIQAV